MNQKIINEYYKKTKKDKVKKYGQFFTPKTIAKYMFDWITENSPECILDPAIGNNVFLENLSYAPKTVKGYDIDNEIVNFFSKFQKYNVDVQIDDYLLNGWNDKWDAIIANPPYNRFQNIENKELIRREFKEKLGLELNGYSNQYLLFLLKSLHELKDGGRMAYIIPTEFMNLEYGKELREGLTKKGYLFKLIYFNTKLNKPTLFTSAITTSCILLIEKRYHETSIFEKAEICDDGFTVIESITLTNLELSSMTNWKKCFIVKNVNDKNLVQFNKYIKVSRGIATGDNDYFLFNKYKMNEYNLAESHFYKVICKAPFIKKPFFNENEFFEIVDSGKDAYLFDGTLCKDYQNEKYLQLGITNGILDKYLVSSRKIWYESEKKDIAPIWICGNSREKMKVVRNNYGIKNLTTFHGIYIKQGFENYLKVIFCYLQSRTSIILFDDNKKEYAGGLNKFQPGDIQKSLVIDFEKMSNEDMMQLNTIYDFMEENNSLLEEELAIIDQIFEKYL